MSTPENQNIDDVWDQDLTTKTLGVAKDEHGIAISRKTSCSDSQNVSNNRPISGNAMSTAFGRKESGKIK
ncbi:hypothetical protein VNI00_015937 [Paramarasmius palmivorus]|uniref:Uncharacterized protein n=1 Tax=Paramarasmius palmivorus TaxID=297713 RepID=A0AAW0BGV8_9AGAR